MTIWEHSRRPLGSPSAGWRAGANARAFGLELGLAALGGLIYFLIRGGVVDRAEEAFGRAADLVDLERALGLFWEPAMQGWILDSPTLIALFNGVYFWLHMPLILAMAVWLLWRHRDVYRLTRNAFLVSAVIALVLYATLPVAPPRFFPELGFVDTMALYSEANYQAQEAGPFVNPYAAAAQSAFWLGAAAGHRLVAGAAARARREAGIRRGRVVSDAGAADPYRTALRDRADGQPLPDRRGRGWGGRGAGLGGRAGLAEAPARAPTGARPGRGPCREQRWGDRHNGG